MFYMHVYVIICTYVDVYADVWLRTYVYVHVYVYVDVDVDVHVYVCVLYIYIYIYSRAYAIPPTPFNWSLSWGLWRACLKPFRDFPKHFGGFLGGLGDLLVGLGEGFGRHLGIHGALLGHLGASWASLGR